MGSHGSARRRPAVLAALACVTGLTAAHLLHPSAYVLIAVVVVLLGAGAGWCRGRSLLLLAALGAAAALRYQACTQLLPRDHISRAREFGRMVRLSGVVRGDPVPALERTRLVLKLAQLCAGPDCRRVSGSVLVTVSRQARAAVKADDGDRLVLTGLLRRPQPARNPAAFDYRAYLERQGIHATLSITRFEQVVRWLPRPGSLLNEYLVRPVRRAVARVIRCYLRGESAALLQGMMLGDRQRIPAATQDLFRATGLAHALVISGLHVGLLSGFLYLVLSVGGCSDRTAGAVTVVLLACYALLTGLQAPVVRAVLMVAVVLGGRILGRNGDVYNSLGLAALPILGIWPQSLFGLSFQLSFGATLAIVSLHQPLQLLFPAAWRRSGSRLHTHVITPLCVSLAAQLGTGPLLAYHFHQLALLAPLANLLVVPLLAAALALGMVSVALGLAWLPASLPFAACNSLVLAGMVDLVKGFAAVPGAALLVPRPSLAWMAWSVVALVLTARVAGGLRARRALLAWLLIGGNVVVWGHLLRPAALEVVFLDVGQGDAVFLRFPNGRTMLIDGGRRSPFFDCGERVLLPFLRSRGIQRVDVVVGTHPDSDHIGGLISVLEHVQVGWYLDSGQYSSTRLARQVRRVVAARGVAYRAVSAGDSLVGFGDGGALVLHPRPSWVDADGAPPRGMNNTSVVLRVTWRQRVLLFTGDVENRTDPCLVAWGERLRAQVLKVAHHGSSSSSSVRFVRAVAPDLAVISVGAHNHFGHPAAVTLRMLEGQGARILRTDRSGAVTVRLADGADWVKTMLRATRE